MEAGVIVSRTGYSGEDGFELYIPKATVEKVWEYFLEEGKAYDIQPIGLGARDTLRLEMGYRLYGADMNEKTTPMAAGLSWIVDMDKGHFIGRNALKAYQEKKGLSRVIGLELLARGIPRPHCKVFQEDTQVGEITSGSFSPTLSKGIALAMLPKRIKVGQVVDVDVRGKKIPAKVVKPPFVKPAVLK
jgi:aminomethyltransferase